MPRGICGWNNPRQIDRKLFGSTYRSSLGICQPSITRIWIGVLFDFLEEVIRNNMGQTSSKPKQAAELIPK